MKKVEFRDLVIVHIDRLLLRDSKDGAVSYYTFLSHTSQIKEVFRVRLGEIPKEIEVACEMASSVMSPSKEVAERHIKNAGVLGAGIAGIGLMISAIGAALGWGSGMIAIVTSFIIGANMIPIFGQGAAALALIAIAGYLYFHEDTPQEKTEKAFKSLKNGIGDYLMSDDFWNKYGNKVTSIPKQK